MKGLKLVSLLIIFRVQHVIITSIDKRLVKCYLYKNYDALY